MTDKKEALALLDRVAIYASKVGRSAVQAQFDINAGDSVDKTLRTHIEYLRCMADALDQKVAEIELELGCY